MTKILARLPRAAIVAGMKAFGERGFQSKLGKVGRLYRTDRITEERCWVRAPGWSLAYD
jgi:protein-L-isoaspartate(D-aspartate) O-methyltransferase